MSCHSRLRLSGKTTEEALKNIKGAIALCLECYKEGHAEIPVDKMEIKEVVV